MGVVTVSNSWQKAYTELADFVARNPGIEIVMNKIDIPGDVRPEFYRLFGTVRVAFLEEKFPSLLDEARTLSQNYTSVEKEVTKLLELADISMLSSLKDFLHDPTNYLTRALFDPLFDLLKGRIDIETFEQEASRNIESSFRDSYRLAYEKWVTLTLVKQLAPDKTFNITPPELEMEGEGVPFGYQEPVPAPKECNHLFFDYKTRSSLIVPDFIVHSARINRYVAIKTEPGNAIFVAKDASGKREWYSINAMETRWDGGALVQPDLAIYIADEAKDICLTADINRICRPDLIIECVVQKGWPGKMDVDMIKLCHNTLKPRLGTYIVSREAVSEEVFEVLVPKVGSKEPHFEPALQPGTAKQGEAIHIFTVGFDQSKIIPIVSALMQG